MVKNNRYNSIDLGPLLWGDPALFSIHDDNLYYVYHNIVNDDDSYSIRTIKLD